MTSFSNNTSLPQTRIQPRSPHRSQLIVFAVLVLVNALLAFLTYALGFTEQFNAMATMPPELVGVPDWLLGLANAGIILVVYGLLGVLGYFLARRLGLPGIFSRDGGWRGWFWMPLLFGVVSGLLITLMDRVFASLSPTWAGFTHPEFPFSIIASASAGIGEEILFRLFVMSLWAFLLNLILKRFGATSLALWLGNLIGALAFAAGHLPTAMFLFNTTTPAGIPALVLVELVLLNGLVGLVAGERFMKDGLVAAAGVHFWADIVWHVLFPLLALG